MRVGNPTSDICGDFPREFQGFSFNNEFGAVFGNVFAFAADGFSPDEVKSYVEDIRDAVQKLDDAGGVELIDTRDRVVHIEFSNAGLASLGLDALSEKVAACSDASVGVEFFAKSIELGPPVGKPVQYRITDLERIHCATRGAIWHPFWPPTSDWTPSR